MKRNIDKDIVKELYDSGKSYEEIAQLLGFTK